jgi:alpha-galactosidase
MALAESHLDHTKPDEKTGLPGTMPRRINVTMIGAGSFFTSSILKDVTLIPGNQGGELRLIDIDPQRLALSEKLMNKIVQELGAEHKWTVRASTERRELLPGTDYIVNAIEVSGIACVRHDNDIPLEFGVSQNIGDTIGPGGLMKAMRTVPVWLEILRDVRELCPRAIVLNYTNPMNIMILAGSRAVPEVQCVGLCHSVQGTSRMLAKYAGVPYEQVQWRCSGINHLAWFTEFNGPDGASLYPTLMQMARDRSSEFAKNEPVRSDMMLHFGAFITESSGHLSEYLPYYRKRKDLLDKYTDTGYRGEESFYANNWPNWRQGQDDSRNRQITGEEPIKLDRSYEYGAWIIESVEKNVAIQIHGNVAPNDGLIANLPTDGCVEVACLINQNGIQPTKAGRLPKQMAAICDSNMRLFDLAADAAIERSKELATWALMLDPLTAAVCSPAEVTEMANRLFEAEAEYLPGFR